MKLFTLFLAIAIFILPLISTFPLKGRDCEVHNCELQDYKPICGTDDKGDTKTFTNHCILKTENCLRNQNYKKTADGECP
ncbi:pegasus [Cochliomyia hominivorax]